MKTLKLYAAGLSAIAMAVLMVGIIKFNFIDSPFVGEPTVYVNDIGESIKLQMKADDSIQVNFMEVDGDYLKAFTAHLTASASGTRYESDDGRFVFWSKGDSASIFNLQEELVFQGMLAGNSPKNASSAGQETIYFSESSGTWQDSTGICYTCTPDNGFSPNGAIGHVIWRELHVALLNDLGASPDIEEVRSFFQTQYAEESGSYPVHIQLDGNVFTIQVAVPIELQDLDFFDRQGALLATYEILQ